MNTLRLINNESVLYFSKLFSSEIYLFQLYQSPCCIIVNISKDSQEILITATKIIERATPTEYMNPL